MYHVQAESKVEDRDEYFRYFEAYILENFSADKMLDGLMTGDLEIDIRLVFTLQERRKGNLTTMVQL